MTVCECQSSYALCMIRIIFTRKHGSSESVRLCMSLLDLSFIRRSYTISIHLYLPVPTSPCLPAPHLLVILGNGGVCTPTLSPNHHSVCFSAPICVCVCVCLWLCPSRSQNVPFNLMPRHSLSTGTTTAALCPFEYFPAFADPSSVS